MTTSAGLCGSDSLQEKVDDDLDGYAPAESPTETTGTDGSHVRDAARDSMLLQATLRPLDGVSAGPFSVRVRNLSAGGLMAEADVQPVIGDQISVELRNIGEVQGRIAWVRAPRFGVTFDHPIDPKLARKPLKQGVVQPIITGSGFHRHTHLLG